MKKTALYTFSDSTLNFKEARWIRAKLVGIGCLIGLVVMGTGVVLSHLLGGWLTVLPMQQSSLQTENRYLRDQLKYVSYQLNVVQKQISVLGEKSNETRLMVNLPKLDNDILQAGTGGTDERLDFTSSGEMNTMLNRLRAAADKAQSEIQVQLASYSAVDHTMETNKVKFLHIPALKPMSGPYNAADFGMRLHPVLHVYRMHEGIDISSDVGTPIYAPADGTVEFSGHESGYGVTLELNHGYSYSTVYGHLSKILVREGQIVKRGDLIALSGNSGLSSGPHLHYEVRVNGVAQNPSDFFFDNIEAKDLKN